MAKRDVVDETKHILEMMGESEENVTLLHEDLNQHKTLFQQLKDDLKELRGLKNKNTAELEDNQHLKDNIKTWNKSFLDYAQQIYYHNQELYSDLSSHETELVKNEELLQRNKEILKEKSDKYKQVETDLFQQLELIEKEEEEISRKNDCESKVIVEENKELKNETKTLDEQLEYYENYVKSTSLRDEQEFRDIIASLHDCIASKEGEMDECTKSLEDMKQVRENLEKEAEASFSALQHELTKPEVEIKESTLNIKEFEQKINELYNKLGLVEETTKADEEKYEDHKEELNTVQVNLKELEEKHFTTLEEYKKSLLENDKIYKQQQALSQKRIGELESLKKKIEVQEDCIQAMIKFITQHEITDKDLDLKVEVEKREETNKNVKKHLEKLNKEFDKRRSELEQKLQQDQEQINGKEQINTKLQDDINVFASDLTGLSQKLEQTEMGETERNKQIEELDKRIKQLNTEFEQLKKKKKQPEVEKRANIRHWDSDSSVEGEDRRLSEFVKLKMKHKKNVRK